MHNIFFNKDVLTAEKEIINSLGINPLILMENAGKNSAEIIFKSYIESGCSEIVLLTGKGNNTGDGFVILRHLNILFENQGIKKTFNVFPFFNFTELSRDAVHNFSIINKSDLIETNILDPAVLKDLCVKRKIFFIDAVFGVGFSGELDDNIKSVFTFINSLKEKYITAIDVPSGLNNYSIDHGCLKADLTISMGIRKFETMFYTGREVSGNVIIGDIGINENEFTKYNTKKIFLLDECCEKLYLKKRNKSSHKYQNGKVFILGGNKNYSGAVYLSALSALKTGSGSVITGVTENVKNVIDVSIPEIISINLGKNDNITNENIDIINEKIEWADSVLIGPGIGREEETLTLIREIVIKYPNKNFVIDADGIYAFVNNLEVLKDKNLILTPHFGEFAALINTTADEIKNNFFELAGNFVKEYKIILVLKNAPTIIFTNENIYINSIGNENLGTMGSGDVLSGIISSLLSQSKDSVNAALTGVYMHSKCGDILYEKFGGSGITASQLAEIIPVSAKGIRKK